MKQSKPPAPEAKALALQPFTFRGVAHYAQKPFRRIFFAQFIAAALITAVFTWLLAWRYLPVITEAAQALPDKAGLHSGVLAGFSTPLIAGHKFFTITAKSTADFDPGNTADLQVRLKEQAVEFNSLAGWWSAPYGSQISVDLSRKRIEPWWGAWKPLILGILSVAFLCWLYFSWRLLSFIYMPFVKLIAWFLNREASWTGSSRLASAALLPGAAFLGIGIITYGLQIISFAALAVIFLLHFIIGWIYAAGATFNLPPLEKLPTFKTSSSKRSPFAKQKQRSVRKSNPFARD